MTRHVPSPKNDAVTRANKTVGAARFDGDIGHVIIDASLICRRVAVGGRGCRPQRVDLQRNKLTYSLPQQTNHPSTCARPSTIRWPVSPASASLWGGGPVAQQKRLLPVGMAAAAAVLPPRTAAVAMKTPAVTAMTGAQTTIDNQLNASTATATETATTMTMETTATAAAEARQQHLGGGGQLGGGGGSLARARG